MQVEHQLELPIPPMELAPKRGDHLMQSKRAAISVQARGDDLSYAALLHRINELESDAIEIAEIAATAGRKRDEDVAVVQRRLATLIDALSRADENLASALRLNTTTTRLLAEVGHDMTQPLTVIVSTLETLATRADESERSMIARANAAAGRMERAFVALMEKARLGSSVITPKLRPFPLALLFTELQSQHEDAARKKALEFRVNRTDQQVATSNNWHPSPAPVRASVSPS